MSTDIQTEVEEQIDAQLEDAPAEGVEVETPDGTVLMTPVEEEIAECVSEPDCLDLLGDEDAEIRLAIELKMKDLFAEQHTGRRLREVEEKAKSAHTAAKKACEVQDDRIKECIDELEALYLNEPDPANFPLFDMAKAEVNRMFAKPDSIAPLPPDTFEEALRRKQRDTPVASMGLNESTVKALEALGLNSAFDIVRTFNELGEKGRDPGSLKGITANRLDGIGNALEKITDECQSEWDLAHPATSTDYIVKCNTCGWTRRKSNPGPCPSGHTSGFTVAGEIVDFVGETFAALILVGHTAEQARAMIGQVIASGRTFSNVSEMIEAIYAESRE